MQDEATNHSVIELSRDLSWRPGVSFDPQEITLEGLYVDELSAHRARKVWSAVLEGSFLLDGDHDFRTKVVCDFENSRYLLRCDFISACGRYAFWRLTHNQAPEAQYIIETAHIPNCESRHRDFLEAPDLRSVDNPPSTVDRPWNSKNLPPSLLKKLHKIASKLFKQREK